MLRVTLRQKASVDSLKGEIKERKKTKDEREGKKMFGAIDRDVFERKMEEVQD